MTNSTERNGIVGAALVVGGGIGGMQAALDLAESGYKVYLAENGPAVGGTMAQLDKTFPTNDCAMCIMSPKLVETGRHLNINIITMAEVEGISGHAGDFTVRLRRRPRYVDESKCTGCGDCAAACPITRPDEFNAGLATRKAIYKRYPQAIPNAFAIEKRGEAPCRNACPIEQRAMGYIALIRAGRFADAYRTIREDNPFPAVCGRVCNHRCEDACSRNAAGDQPVSIMRLKRFVADWATKHPGESVSGSAPVATGDAVLAGRRVAVVGAGPAGLTCAADLARQGLAVTVFEALPVAGGMMSVGIPAYRLPRPEVQAEVAEIIALGVDLRLGCRVTDADALLRPQGEYDAVFIAVGAHVGLKLRIPGSDLPGVLTATDFLREISLAGDHEAAVSGISGRRVLVIGGGNVAVDAAMSAVRLGASQVAMACLESREQMPAHEWELADAVEEGIALYPARAFHEIVSESGQVTGVRTSSISFRGFVAGRPDFDELPGTEVVLACDVVIFAIGQRPDLELLSGWVDTAGVRTVPCQLDTLATSRQGVFAGGDAVTGTAFVVDAIAAGHRAASSIVAYLQQQAAAGDSTALWPPAVKPHVQRPIAELSPAEAHAAAAARPTAPRVGPARRPASERRGDFREIEAPLTEAQAMAEAGRCLECGICSECLQCAFACRAGAIDHEDLGCELELNVGAVILAPGLQTVAGDIRPEFGYGVYPNVVSSLEFERMLSASGPYAGIVQQPSDGRHPRKIAFIQCVGSRDLVCRTAPGAAAQEYCSAVCCMYATKEALIAREHDESIEPTIFYMDVRAFGKGFERYYQRAGGQQGVRYVRSAVSCVKQAPGSGNLRVLFMGHDGKSQVEEFDLVVLAVGLVPSAGAQALAGRLGVELNRFGFAESPAYAPAATNVPGIFVAGAFAGPKDIPETVIEASAAASQAAQLLAPARGTLTRTPEYPPERDISQEEPRVGVFVCHCGINIGGVVNVPEVVAQARTLPHVVYAEHNLYTCSQDTQARIQQRIAEYGINRVVVASCTPRTHEPLFQDTIRQAGLNPHVFEMANIREQDSWVHRADRAMATAKATDMVAMAVAKAARLRPLYRHSLDVDHRALVVGGGLAGLAASLALAGQGFETHLVESGPALGGNLRHIYVPTAAGADPQALLAGLVDRVSGEPRIHVYLEAEVAAVAGYVGQYRTTIRQPGGQTCELGHGVAIIATGGQAIEPKGYLYGQHPGVITQRELEARLAGLHRAVGVPQRVVMIQCVGSRDAAHPYCSRICCTQAIKNALAIKQRNPETQITVLYRDIRTYGFRELLFQQARKAGVLFLEYAETEPPVVSEAGDELTVDVALQPEGERIRLHAGLVVLAAGIEPMPGNAALAQLFKVPLSEDGFFMEAHAKLRPLDFAADGVFLAGLAHSPRFIEETLAQAYGAAVRAGALLSRKQLQSAALVAAVNPRLCSACGLCVETCPYGARLIDPDERHARVLEVLCQGCGACVAACPNGASCQRGFEFGQVFSMIDAALERG